MSIGSEISRLKGNISDSYNIAETLGAELPSIQNSANLASTLTSIPMLKIRLDTTDPNNIQLFMTNDGTEP